MGSTIIGCGKSLPKLEVANDELKALVDTNDEWISTRTGIRSRHVAVEETATDLAEAAARQALGLADGGWREDGEAIDPASIDLVIYATITPDVLVPSAAGLLRRRLGKIGLVLRAFARGEDATPVKPYDQARNEVDRTVKSFGNGLTAPHDIVSASDAKALVYLLSESVAQRLREARFRASTVSIGVRSARDLASYSRQTTLRRATNVTGIVARTAWGLLAANEPLDGEHPLRGLHVRASNLEPCDAPQQLELAFDARRRMLEELGRDGSTTCAAASATPASSAARSCWTRACWGWISRRRTSCIPWATSTTEGGEGRVVLLRGGRALPVILGKRRGLRLPLRMTTCGPFDARRAEAGAKGEPWQFFKGSSTSSGRLVFARQAFLGRRGGRATVFRS